ncbi:MAG TPA: ATP-grasp domain-containing protein [Methanoregula sp.]|nr:ATP-grasp domain-containing protein [Methanoregula sp.]
MKGRVLVVGFSTRHVVQSAARAGYEVCAVDHFCDQDLCWITKDRERFADLADLPAAIERICRRHTFDFLVVTSGAEDLSPPVSLCGTPKEKIGRFLDKLETQYFFEQLNVPVPKLLPDGKYPAMVKPRRGAGGWRNSIVCDKKGLTEWEDLYPATPFIRQEIIEGVPASVCCITDGSHARAIAVNEQFLRGNEGSAFGFSGSVTPLDHPLSPVMIMLAEQIAASSGCSGTIGIDFVLGKDSPYAIEVNPRFQGTVDTVEMACACNLFRYHVDACRGILPPVAPTPNQVAVRSILFADRNITIKCDLKHLASRIADIPWPGTFFEEGQALVSVFGWGKTREDAFSLLDKHISTVRQYIR